MLIVDAKVCRKCNKSVINSCPLHMFVYMVAWVCACTYPILVVGQSAVLFQLVFPQLLKAVVHAAR